MKALIATSALGMGFDASLGFVINLGAPQSPVAYYQQVGRAGRGTDEATVVLLPQIEDRDIWAYFASLGFPREEQVRETLAALAESDRPMSTATLETRVELGRNRLESMLKVLDVDGAVQRVQGGWVATGRSWDYDAERYARVSEAREREQQAMLDYLRTDQCRMRFLREQLDDPDAADCGRCDNCGGLALSTDVSEAAVAEAGERLSRPGVVVEPRKMWPTALANLGLDLKGKIAGGAEPGRAVARLTDLGHGQALRALFREDTPDGPVPPALRQAVMDVMKDWAPEWAARPDAIVVVESATRPDPDPRPGRQPRPRHAAARRRHVVGARPVGPAAGRPDQLGAARRRRTPPGRARRRGAAGGDGAAGRRPGRDRLDPHGRGRRDPRRRCERRAPAGPGDAGLSPIMLLTAGARRRRQGAVVSACSK